MNASLLSLAIRRTEPFQTLSIFMTLLLLLVTIISSIAVVFRWKKYGKRSLMPLGTIILSAVLVVPTISLGRIIRDRIFFGNLPRYEAAVRLIDDGLVQRGDFRKTIELPKEYDDIISHTEASKTHAGILTVEFVTGGGFPVKHVGYLFLSRGPLQSWHKDRWPHSSKVKGNWYEISD